MSMSDTKRARLEADLAEKRERRTLYLEREKEMLSGGVQSYGTGSRNLTRYNTDLAQVRAEIDKLGKEVAELEAALDGGAKRKRVALVARDW